ncbi:hypothetical protein SLEP1_g40147 [Rubroshorea leprosula]|uniref:Uncharacterized protein n=1 Tax=Rubroshorea leprosula TaxID=152421 RepID=A0AAV5L2Y5_9ROSI|nr:hypothetical protein SLEP1_g40147 [Rubroshorea leprosula]
MPRLWHGVTVETCRHAWKQPRASAKRAMPVAEEVSPRENARDYGVDTFVMD